MNALEQFEEFLQTLSEHEKPRDSVEKLRMQIAFAAGGQKGIESASRIVISL